MRDFGKHNEPAFAQPDLELRHLFAKRGPWQRCVGADDVALGTVRNPAQDVLPRAVCLSKADESSARVVLAPLAKPEYLAVAAEPVENEMRVAVSAVLFGHKDIVRTWGARHGAFPSAKLPGR